MITDALNELFVYLSSMYIADTVCLGIFHCHRGDNEIVESRFWQLQNFKMIMRISNIHMFGIGNDVGELFHVDDCGTTLLSQSQSEYRSFFGLRR